MKKAFKYKIKPTEEQKEQLSQFFGCVRYVYNWGLARKMEAWRNEGKRRLSCFELCKELTILKRQEGMEWLNDCASVCLQYSLFHLDAAYKNYFRKTGAFPRFKNKGKAKDVCQFINRVRFDFEDWQVHIPKVGWMKMCKNRAFDAERCKQGTLTVMRDRCGEYWCSVVVETGEDAKLKAKVSARTAVGIDLGIKNYATLSDGTKYENPKHIERMKKRIMVLQRRLARTEETSKRHEAMERRVSKLLRRACNQRSDHLHKMSAEIVRMYDTICLETLDVEDMMKKGEGWITRFIYGASWGEFMRMLQYKAEWQGKNVVFIDRYEPTSQVCSCCGRKNKATKNLSVRKWACPECGAVHDRDVNAAKNILRLGLSAVG